jgi:hypothetical protein
MGRKEQKGLHPSSNLATTIPLPPRADSRKPAFTTVKIAKPFACSKTEHIENRVHRSAPGLNFRPASEGGERRELTIPRNHTIQPTISRSIDERAYYEAKEVFVSRTVRAVIEKERERRDERIFAALRHSSLSRTE